MPLHTDEPPTGPTAFASGGVIHPEWKHEPTDEDMAGLRAALSRNIRFRGPSTDAAPTAVTLRRRTPEERRAYLTEHRAEAIANGIPADLVDMMIAEGEA